MTIGPLFAYAHAQALARRTDPDTSRQAVARVPVAKLERLVLEILRVHGPLTTHQIAERAFHPLVSISPRMKPMQLRGLVERTGERRDGRCVWAATEPNG